MIRKTGCQFGEGSCPDKQRARAANQGISVSFTQGIVSSAVNPVFPIKAAVRQG
jgi:hypothetical protein